MMATAAGLKVDYIPLAALAALSPAAWNEVLGIVSFDDSAAPGSDHQVPVAASPTPVLGSNTDLCEVWRALPQGNGSGASDALPVATSRAGRVNYRGNGHILFGQITMSESSRIGLATGIAYQEIFQTLNLARYPHLVRIWNTLPQINGDDGGLERYRHFNSARQAAFTDNGRVVEGGVPAASALGSSIGSPLSIYFLATRQAPTMIENPRQVSAYHYPPEYGAASPTFSRGCVLNGMQGTTLFVSGTASIVGHRSLHPGDAALQARESLANIESLLREANRVADGANYVLRELKFKVYVRNPDDLAEIEGELCAALGSSACILYLKADVCRENLLVEIEATGET